MAVVNKSEFNQLIEDNLKTAAGQPKSKGPGVATIFRSIRDTLFGTSRVESITTDDPGGDDTPVPYKFGAVYDPQTLIDIDQEKVLQFEVNGTIHYVPIIKQDSSLDPILENSFIVANKLDDFPDPVGNIITITAGVNYLITSEIDLEGNRLEFDDNVSITGVGFPECKLFSTGLPPGQALITADSFVRIRDITFEAVSGTKIFDIDGSALTDGLALITNCKFEGAGEIGDVANYDNFILDTILATINDGINFTGDFKTIGFNQLGFFPGGSSGVMFNFDGDTVITNRFRCLYSTFELPSGVTGFNVDDTTIDGATVIPTEGFILDNVFFDGNGTPILGIDFNDNEALFFNCRGITNSVNATQYFMTNNATTTTINVAGTYEKIAGTTQEGTFSSKFELSGQNRATYKGAKDNEFTVIATATVSSGNNLSIAMRVTKNGTTIQASQNSITTDGAGAGENIIAQSFVQLDPNDYIEMYITNEDNTTDVTVSELNVLIKPV